MLPRFPGGSGIVDSLNPFARTRNMWCPVVTVVKVSFPVASVRPRRISSTQTMALGSEVIVIVFSAEPVVLCCCCDEAISQVSKNALTKPIDRKNPLLLKNKHDPRNHTKPHEMNTLIRDTSCNKGRDFCFSAIILGC